MNKSEILYKAVTEHLIINDNIFDQPRKQWYLCLAVQVSYPFNENNLKIREVIEEDVRYNGYMSGFGYGDFKSSRNQMQVAMYGLFLSEYFKDIE